MATDAGVAAPRIVSLLPAATEIVAALGALDQLVGITHECDHPPGAMHLPRVTASAIDRDAASAVIDADVRALASVGAAVFTLDVAHAHIRDLRREADRARLAGRLPRRRPLRRSR